MSFSLHMTPKGNLQFGTDSDAPPLSEALADRLAADFARGAGFGLLQLGAAQITTALPPLWAFWRNFAARFVTALTATPEDGEIVVTAPDALALETLCLDAPLMTGAEYLAPEIFLTLWAEIEAAMKAELAAAGSEQTSIFRGKCRRRTQLAAGRQNPPRTTTGTASKIRATDPRQHGRTPAGSQ